MLELIQSTFKKSKMEMIKSKLSQINLNPAPHEIESDLMKYCQNGSLKQIEFIFDKFVKEPGFNINCSDSQGNSPLILASKRGHGHIVEILLLHTPDITMENARGETVLHVAPKSIHKMLLQAFAASSIMPYSSTSLCNACFLGNDQLVQRFFHESFNKIPRRKNDSIANANGIECIFLPLRHTSLLESLCLQHKYSYHPHLVLQILLSNIYTPDPNLILLHVVATNPSKSAGDLCKVLLDRKFSPISTDQFGFTPIHYASRSGNAKVLEMLLHKASLTETADNFLNTQAKAGNTPLHLAAMEGREQTVKILLKYGANKDLLNSQGHTAKHCAKNNRIKLLLIPPKPVTNLSSNSSQSALSLHRSNTTISQISLTNRPLTHRHSSNTLRSQSTTEAPFLSKSLSKLDFSKSLSKRPINPLSGLPEVTSKSFEFVLNNNSPLKPISKSDSSTPENVKDEVLEKKTLLPELVKSEGSVRINKRKNKRPPPMKKKAIKPIKKEEYYENDFESDNDTVVGEEIVEELMVGDGDGDDDEDGLFEGEEVFKSDRKVSTYFDEKLIDFDNFQKGQLLGKGGYGYVFKVLLADGQFCVMKEVAVREADPLSEHNKGNTKEIKRETEILLNLKHKNIVQCYGIEDAEDYVYIFMELVSGGSIADLLKEFKLSERMIKNYTSQLVEAVKFLHENSIVHRDIKGANVMITSKGVIKLIDFGCAKKCHPLLSIDSWGSNHDDNSSCHMGSIYWMAPELLKNEDDFVEHHSRITLGFKSDIWSIGCTVYEMVTTRPPHFENSYFNLMYLICRNQLQMPSLLNYILPHDNSSFSQAGVDFVNSCFTWEPMLRPSAEDLSISYFLHRVL